MRKTNRFSAFLNDSKYRDYLVPWITAPCRIRMLCISRTYLISSSCLGVTSYLRTVRRNAGSLPVIIVCWRKR